MSKIRKTYLQERGLTSLDHLMMEDWDRIHELELKFEELEIQKIRDKINKCEEKLDSIPDKMILLEEESQKLTEQIRELQSKEDYRVMKLNNIRRVIAGNKS